MMKAGHICSRTLIAVHSSDRNTAQRFLDMTMLVIVLVCTSCTTIGADKLVSSHTAYNDAVQLTVTREVLANIVRSRYADPMQFIAVSAINAQFSVNVGATGGVAGIGQEGTEGQAAGSIGYSDSPTITFIPQSDAGFYKSLHNPFEVSETVGIGLAYRFASSDPDWQALSLRFSFASINGADDYVEGRSGELYNRRIEAIVRLLQRGARYRQVPEWDFDTTSIAKAKVTAEDMVAAFRMGMNFIEEDDGENVRLARYRLVLALVLPTPDDPGVIDALEALGVIPGRSQYILRPPLHSAPDEKDPYAIWVTPRSMIDVINLAARFVEIPDAHYKIVPPLEPVGEAVAKITPVRILSSEEEPPFPYRVQHRGYWFYVDDLEIDSKVFLEVLVAAYSSRVGSKQAGDSAPQVVLPVGGG
jgi:hypothetical protein